MIEIKRTFFSNEDFRELTALLDDELISLYPDTHQQFESDYIIDETGRVVLVYCDGNLSGCGCFRPTATKKVVEIKRMFVKKEFRGKGIAKRILFELEKWTMEENYSRTILVTGIYSPEAVSLYTKMGYKQISTYGIYQGDPESICMGKNL